MGSLKKVKSEITVAYLELEQRWDKKACSVTAEMVAYLIVPEHVLW